MPASVETPLLGRSLTGAERDALEALEALVLRWAERANLVSVRNAEELRSRHVLDSLAAAPLLAGRERIADLGSGAGFPALPLAIVSPGSRFFLVESRRRRASLLREAARRLALENVEVLEGRGEAAVPALGGVDAVISRAVALPDVLSFARAVLGPGGRIVAFAKAASLPETPAGFERAEVRRYDLPGTKGHAVVAFDRRFT